MRLPSCRSGWLAATTLALLMGGSQASHAVDTQPFDYVPAPPGTTLGVFYGLYGHNRGVAMFGNAVQGTLDSYIGVARFAHYFEVGGLKAAANVLLPYGTLRNGMLGGARLNSPTGFGDPTLASALWLVDDPQARRHVAVTGYLSVPLGQYQASKTLNLGANRVGGTLQLGGITGLGESWSLEGVADVTVNSENRAPYVAGAVLKQSPTVTGQLWLSYQATPTLSFSSGYAVYGGGIKRLNGVNDGFNAKKQQVRLAAGLWAGPTLNLYGQVNHDFMVQGGFKQEVSALIRVAKVF